MDNSKIRTLVYITEPSFEGAKVKDVLSKHLLLSDGLISRLKRVPDGILVNDTPVYVTYALRCGDVVRVTVGDQEKDPRLSPVSLPLTVLYEDRDLLIIDKPAGIAVHPSRDPEEITLENAVAAMLGPYENPHPVSRLDKGTSGLMLFAKSGWAHSLMKRVQNAGVFQKNYYAILHGCPPAASGVVDAPIGAMPGSTYQRMVRPDGAPSVSEYTVLRRMGDLTLVRLTPHTGRTHQLRVHMAYLGCPLLGDWLYGSRDSRIDRPALHATSLSFPHPLDNQTVSVSSPLPKDMRELFQDPV